MNDDAPNALTVYASEKKPLPNPTAQMLAGDRLFDAIYETIKSWDVSVPEYHEGYCGANGSHAALIYEAVQRENPASLLAANSRLHYRNQALSARLKAAGHVIRALTEDLPYALYLTLRGGGSVAEALGAIEALIQLRDRIDLLERAVLAKDLALFQLVIEFLEATKVQCTDEATQIEVFESWRKRFFAIVNG